MSGGMFQYSYMFVRMYSRLADGEHVVSVSIDPSGTMLSLQVFNRQCTLYESLFSEDEVEAMKQASNPALTWSSFFELLQKSFAEHTIEFATNNTGGTLTVTLKHERQTDAVPVAAFTATIPVNVNLVSKPEEINNLCESMISFVSLRTGDKAEMERVENVIRIESAIKEEAVVLNQELTTFEEELGMIEKKKKIAEAEMKELGPQLTAAVGGAWEQTINNRLSQEQVVCQIPDPLRGDAPLQFPASPVDTNILKVVKSHHIQPSSVEPHNFRHHDVILPFEKGPELDNAVTNLSLDEPARKELYNALQQASDWEFDIFHFEKLCGKVSTTRDGVGPKAGPLFMLGYDLFFALELSSRFNVSERTFISWLSLVERGYENVPFHCSLHAADVLQCLRYILIAADGANTFNLSPTVKFALFFAACIIDFRHDGTNNDFHVRTKSALATLYSNQSVLERHHVGSILELMLLPRYNIFDGMPSDTKREIIDIVLALVLATDMSMHEQFVQRFRQKMQEGSSDFSSLSDQVLAAQIIFKATDYAFCARPQDIYIQWASRLQQEYRKQGEKEAALGLKVSDFMDEGSSTSLALQARMQLTIINVASIPLFSLLTEYLPQLRVTGEYTSMNRNHWANAEST